MKQQIVIAWAEMTGTRPTGRTVRFDGVNYRTEFEPCLEAHALMWLRRGGPADVDKAKLHAKNMNARVFTFPAKEKYPLEKARERVLSDAVNALDMLNMVEN